MSGYPSNWTVYSNRDAILRPRRRNIFFKGRRRSDRWMARAIILLALALIGMTIKAFWGDAPLRSEAVAHEVATHEVAAREAVVFYGNCAEARAAGAAPIHRGEPGYSPRLDADGDGVACEPWVGR